MMQTSQPELNNIAPEMGAETQQGYLAGRYEDKQLGFNNASNINTNAVVLESLLYEARGRCPLTKQ